MHRFFLPDTPLVPNQTVDLSPISHQVRKVLRMKPGEQIILLDNKGSAYLTEIRALIKGSAIGHVISQESVTSEPPIPLILYQCVLKGGNFDWVLQKGTELGVSQFIPVISSRTVVRPAEKVEKKMDRYRSIIREAAEQSGRGRLPTIASPISWEEMLTSAQGCRFLPWEEAAKDPPNPARSLGESLPESGSREPISLVIGPEGGFDEEEVTAAQTAGWQVVSMGPRILRAETAALAAVTVVLHRMARLG